jgi:acyl-CoA synthetase (AMP-forming)/AMP-acid ligase II
VYDQEPQPADQVRRYQHADDVAIIPYRVGASVDEAVRADAVTTAGLFQAGEATVNALSLTHEDRVLLASPLSEKLGFGCAVYGALLGDAKLITVNRSFNAEEVLDAISKQRPTTLVATAEQVEVLAAAAAADAASDSPRFVTSSVTKGLVGVSSLGESVASFGSASLLPVDTEAMFSADVPLKLV